MMNDARGYTTLEAEARGRVGAAKALLARDEETLVMYRKLYARRAISLEEYEGMRRRHAVSVAKLAQSEKFLEQALAEGEASRLQLQARLGREMTVRDLYGSYAKAWSAGCDRIDKEVDEGVANVQYTRFRVDMVRRLYAKQAESYENLLMREAEYLEAVAGWEAKAGRAATCRKDLFPTYDEVARLLGP